jgi:hypothetical protein
MAVFYHIGILPERNITTISSAEALNKVFVKVRADAI